MESPFWSIELDQLLRSLETQSHGLYPEEALKRRQVEGKNVLPTTHALSRTSLFFRQYTSPISLLLLAASILSAIVGDSTDGFIILGILLLSGSLGFLQELRANKAIQSLLLGLESQVEVLRQAIVVTIPVSEVVRGEIVKLSAGSKIPADCRIIESRDLFVSESALTGESSPAEKHTGIIAPDAALIERTNCLFLGSYVVSGTATAVVVHCAPKTIYGQIVQELEKAPAPSEFELGVTHFGYLLLEVAVVMSLVVLAINLSLGSPALETLLFTLSLTVGMTPQLLPAIVTTTLAQVGHLMAKKGAIVRRLNSIADIGGIDILCTDKTGTITEAKMRWVESLDGRGNHSERARLFGYLNALHETGYANPIDDAIRAERPIQSESHTKIDEIPYDFTRRRVSVLVDDSASTLLLTKGAFAEVSNICESAELADQVRVPFSTIAAEVTSKFQELSEQGYRCLAIAYRRLEPGHVLAHSSEQNLTFLGFLTFADPVKDDAASSIQKLERLGIECKVITGDNRYVAAHVARLIGVIDARKLLTGGELGQLDSQALARRVRDVDLFAEIDPHDKERIILALRAAGYSVGYLGDGINDASALHAADVGISVDTATDVTREASDILLLRKDLGILIEAVIEGRRAFANTLKYVFVSTSANFGNMFSMAGASLITSFLPLLPKQILLLNIFSDLPAMAIATDSVDTDITAKPLRWNAHAIGCFMAIYGLISSFFDYLTFVALLAAHVTPEVFRSAWFIESLCSEILILLVIRTRRATWRSPAGAPLLALSACSLLTACMLPYSSIAGLFGMAPVPAYLIATIVIILVTYVTVTEVVKHHNLRGILGTRSWGILPPNSGPN